MKPDYVRYDSQTRTPQAEVWLTEMQAYPTGWVCPKYRVGLPEMRKSIFPDNSMLLVLWRLEKDEVTE